MTLLFRMLAVIGSGMFAGVLLAIGVILGGYWRSLPPAGFQGQFAQHAGFIMRAIPLALLPAIVGLAGATWTGWNDGAARNIWLGADACIFAVLVLTILYFVPANAAFEAGRVPVGQVPGRLATWLFVHSVRVALATCASGLGVWAVARSA